MNLKQKKNRRKYSSFNVFLKTSFSRRREQLTHSVAHYRPLPLFEIELGNGALNHCSFHLDFVFDSFDSQQCYLIRLWKSVNFCSFRARHLVLVGLLNFVRFDSSTFDPTVTFHEIVQRGLCILLLTFQVFFHFHASFLQRCFPTFPPSTVFAF